MPTKAEREAAQKKLDEAVADFVAFAGWNKGMVTTGYVLVVSQQGFDQQGFEISGYPIVYSGGSMPDHSALGVLQVASDTIRGVGRWTRSGDDD